MNRLVFSKLLALAVGIGCVFFAFKYNKNALYETSGSIYGTYWKLVSTEYIPDPLIQSIKQELDRIDLIASNYKPSSELSIINAAPINTEIGISSEMYTILKFAEDLHQLMRAWELKHRALVSQCVTEHTLFREETRWPGYYYRSDFKKLDDNNWHCLTLSRRDPETGKFTMEKAPLYHIVDEEQKKAG